MSSAEHVVYQNGQYISAYGGGINFGLTFTHPSSLTTAESGYQWAPIFSGSVSGNNILSTISEGAFFTNVYGTAVNGLVGQVRDYSQDYHFWIKEKAFHIPAPVGQWETVGGNGSSGYETVKGQFVTDITSPTFVSIVSQSYAAPQQPTQPNDVINGYLRIVEKNGIQYELEGYNGIIASVKNVTSGLSVYITNFNGGYLVGRRGDFISIDLTINPGTASEVVFSAESINR